MRLKNPLNRKAEVLLFFIKNYKKDISQYHLAFFLSQLNAHKYIARLEDEDNILFNKRYDMLKNVFGDIRRVRKYNLKSRVTKARRVYNKINVKNKL